MTTDATGSERSGAGVAGIDEGYLIAMEVDAAAQVEATKWAEKREFGSWAAVVGELSDDRSHGDEFVADAAMAVSREWSNERNIGGYLREVFARAEAARLRDGERSVTLSGEQGEREASPEAVAEAVALLEKWSAERVAAEREFVEQARVRAREVREQEWAVMAGAPEGVVRSGASEISLAPELVRALERELPVEHPREAPAKGFYTSYLEVDRMTGVVACGVVEVTREGGGRAPQHKERFHLHEGITGAELAALVRSDEFRAMATAACQAFGYVKRGPELEVVLRRDDGGSRGSLTSLVEKHQAPAFERSEAWVAERERLEALARRGPVAREKERRVGQGRRVEDRER